MGTTRTKSFTNAILHAGFIAGLLDITGATISYVIQRHREPTRMYQFIASGVFGKKAFEGGWIMAALGLLFHFMVAYIFTLIFFFLYPRIRLLSKNRVVTGLVYGLLVWSAMQFVVLPLSNVTRLPLKPVQAMIGIGVLMLCIGLPLSFMAYRYYRGRGDWRMGRG
jgi:hypothetical protein